ncbi:MAG: UDP-3-O-(3-hydroxymyristoyl)glucosamine N-acyltransferase [Acidobacteriota bacterium]
MAPAPCILAPAVKLADLAAKLGCRLEGDGTVDVTRVAALEDAGPGDLTFLTNPKYASRLRTTRASAVIVGVHTEGAPCAVLRTDQPYVAVADAVQLLTPPRRPAPGISGLASIDPSARLADDVFVGAFVSVGAAARVGPRTAIHAHVVIGEGAVLGADCTIHAHVSIREAVVIGDRVVIQDGAVIGSDGFGFARRRDGTHQKIPQIGRVVIEDDVEIGAQSAVDRPAIGETRIGAGTKVDNLVQVAHGVRIGRNVLLAAQVGIAGSTVLEDDVVMAGQSGATGHVRLGRGAMVSAKSAVTKDVEVGHHVAGVPAADVSEWRESAVLVRRLPELKKTIADLQARLAALEARLMS